MLSVRRAAARVQTLEAELRVMRGEQEALQRRLKVGGRI